MTTKPTPPLDITDYVLIVGIALFLLLLVFRGCELQFHFESNQAPSVQEKR